MVKLRWGRSSLECELRQRIQYSSDTYGKRWLPKSWFYHQIIMFLVPSDDRVKRLQAILVETSALHKQLLQQIAVHATDMVIILQPIFPSFFRLINTIIRIDHQLITTTTPQCNYHHLSIWYRRQLQIISLHSHLLGVWHMACRAVSLWSKPLHPWLNTIDQTFCTTWSFLGCPWPPFIQGFILYHFFTSRFIAADFQLYCLGITIYVFCQNPKLRNLVLSTLFFIGMVIPGLHTYFQDLDPSVIVRPR